VPVLSCCAAFELNSDGRIRYNQRRVWRQRSEPETSRSSVAAQATPPTPVEKQAQEATPPPSEESAFKEWVASQLEARGVSFVDITDRKPWPLAPEPNTSIVLGLAKRPAPATFGIPFVYFPYILLIQTTENPLPPKLLGLELRTDLNVGDPKDKNSDTYPKTIDIGPYQITNNEYAFGVTVIEGSLGNKSGQLYELLGLYRYQNGELKEIYRDVLWVYSKYSEPDYSSCNIDLKIVTQPAESG
jgi:hypothetical protein